MPRRLSSGHCRASISKMPPVPQPASNTMRLRVRRCAASKAVTLLRNPRYHHSVCSTRAMASYSSLRIDHSLESQILVAIANIIHGVVRLVAKYQDNRIRAGELQAVPQARRDIKPCIAARQHVKISLRPSSTCTSTRPCKHTTI